LAELLLDLPYEQSTNLIELLGSDTLPVIIRNGAELGDVLAQLPEANRFSFCVDTFGAEALKAIITGGSGLGDVLLQLPEAKRLSFCVDTLGIDALKAIIKNWFGLGYVLAQLPQANWLSFCVALEAEALKAIIIDGSGLSNVLAQLPQTNRFSFCVDTLGVVALKAIITGAYGLGNVLDELPEASRLSFCVDTLGAAALKAIIPDGYELGNVLRQLPEASRLSFCLDSLGYQFIVPLKDNDAILKQLYNADKNSTFSFILLSERIKCTTDDYITFIEAHRQNSWFHGERGLERAKKTSGKLTANPPPTLNDVITLLQTIDEKSGAVFSLPHSLKNMLTKNLKCFFATEGNQNPSLGEIIQELHKMDQRGAAARPPPRIR